MLARPDVDRDRVAVIGVSQAGYWVPRALAFEHRFAAAVADPGVVDVSTAWTDSLPHVMRKQLQDGKQTAFDREMHLAELFQHDTKTTLTFRGHPYGLENGSRFALFQTVTGYRLGAPQVADRPATLGIRPEHVLTGPLAMSAPVRSEVTVDLVEPMGSDTLVWAELAGTPFRIRMDGTAQVKPGDRLPIGLDPSKASMFDRKTEERL